MQQALLNFLLAAVILGVAFVITQWFAGNMYYRCSNCGTLNAKRRDKCRSCGAAIGSHENKNHRRH
ncbi:MAG TPA: hypothetical protein VGK99_11780 [Acidobacteriota bacterium]